MTYRTPWIYRILFIALVVLLGISHPPRTFAQTVLELSADEGTGLPDGMCNGVANPGDICHIAPDVADDPVTVGMSTPTCHIVYDRITHLPHVRCLSVGSIVNHLYDLFYRPGPGYKRPMYDVFAKALALATPWLTAGIIKQETIDFTNPQFESDMGKVCYFNNAGDKVFTDIALSKFLIALPWINSLVQNADILAQQNSLRKRTDMNYEQATEYIKKAALHACGYRSTGTESYVEEVSAIGEVRFRPYTVQSVVDRVALGYSIRSHAIIENSKRTGKIEQVAAFGPGVTFADLAESPLTSDERTYYATTPGFIETFRPMALDYHPAEINGRVLNNPFIGAFTKNNTNTYLDKLIDNGYKYLCTTLFPSFLIPNRCRPEPTPTPTPATGLNCNQNVPEQSVAGLNSSGGENYANNAYANCPNNGDNGWQKCKNDVIARAKKACVDPIFALAIWLHESAASSYTCGEKATGAQIEDFGIHTAPNVHPENFNEQINYFLNTEIDGIAARCPTKTMQDFVSIYWFGNSCYDQETPDNQSKINDYINDLQYIYGDVLGGGQLPTWPKSPSC